MGRLSSDSMASATRKRQDDAYELGKSAGRYAGERVVDHLRDKHCLTDDERDEFDKGLKEGRKESGNG